MGEFMRNLTIALVMLFVTINFAMAQNNAQSNEELKNKSITATFVVGDVVFAYNSLNTIQIQGNEVDAFLEVKESMKKYIQQIESEQLKIDANITMEMNVVVANNLLIFLQRVTLQGANAERHKRFRQTMLDAAKELN